MQTSIHEYFCKYNYKTNIFMRAFLPPIIHNSMYRTKQGKKDLG